MAQQINESVQVVQQALKELEAEGEIREEQAADGRTLYLATAKGNDEGKDRTC